MDFEEELQRVHGKDSIERLRTLNAELLAACKAAASLLRKLGGKNHDPEYSELLAAIAKAEQS